MKKSLFDKNVREEVTSRLDKLSDTTKREWGTMSPAQMVHHVYLATRISTRELKLPDRSSFFTRTVIRYFMLNGMVPSKKRLEKSPPQTFDEINVIKANIPADDLAREKQRLKEQWGKIAGLKEFPDRHPIIGKMKRENWGQQLYSHANYHLRQFGL